MTGERHTTSLIRPIIQPLFIPLSICLILLIGSCGGTQVQPSPAREGAAGLSAKAEAAFRRGNYETALSIYRETLRINRSVEDMDGIAISLINSAVVLRKMGDNMTAHGILDEALQGLPESPSTVRKAEASFVKALLYLEQGDPGPASSWADKALGYCSDNSCLMKGKIYNLKARIAGLRNDRQEAEPQVLKALYLNREAEDHEEEANSLRLYAEGKALSGQYEEALSLYGEALQLDRALGLSGKVAVDLLGIGKVYSTRGLCEQALQYFTRAGVSAEAGGYLSVSAQARQLKEQCSAGSGKR